MGASHPKGERAAHLISSGHPPDANAALLTPETGRPHHPRQGVGTLHLFDINITPKNMSVDELQKGFLQLAKQLYSAAETYERRRKFKTKLETAPRFGRRAARNEGCLLAA